MTDTNASQSAGSNRTDPTSLLQLPLLYWKQTLAGVLVVVAAAGGYALYGVYQKSQVEKAETELGSIILAKTGADRLTALEALAKNAPAGARDGIWLAAAQTATDMGDFTKAAAAWDAVSKTAPSGMKTVAGLGYAAALSKAGQDAKAVEVLEAMAGSAPKAFSMTIDRQLAVTAEAAGQWQKALAAYERMKADGNVQNASFIDARIADLKGKTAGAAKTNG